MHKYGSLLLGFMVSGVVLANPITITNSARVPLSVKINGICSSEYGVIKPSTAGTVNEAALKKLCGNNANHCLAEVVNSTTCHGNLAANFYFHTKNGLSGEGSSKPPFNLFIRKYGVTITQS